MSAVKSKQVVGYDQGGLIVHFVDGSRKSLSSCVKNELIAVCNYLGIKFVGRPPMHFSPLVIESAIKNNQAEIRYVESAPSVPSTPSVPKRA